MKLFVTPTSPYARLTTIVRLELGLSGEVELVWTRTRQPDDPMLDINPSGRVPYLLLDDGTVFEDTDLIVEFLDRLSPARRFARPDPEMTTAEAYWAYRRHETTARSMLDGLSVWGREVVRPANEQSPGIIEHERRRAARLSDLFETLVTDDVFSGPMNLPQLLLFSALNMNR